MNQTSRIAPAPVRKSIFVNVSPERAFRVFTIGMGRWWRPDHHIASTPFAEIVVEPRAGGRWFERDKDGAECEWGKILAWEPPARVVFGWQLNQDWKYDPISSPSSRCASRRKARGRASSWSIAT
jgi:uncharacterized protein YndB with AHSA1/START domain